MRNYRKAIAALVLALVFAAPAFADDGIMSTDKTQPPPPSASSQSTMASDGIIYTDNTQSVSETTDAATQIASSLAQSVPTLFQSTRFSFSFSMPPTNRGCWRPGICVSRARASRSHNASEETLTRSQRSTRRCEECNRFI